MSDMAKEMNIECSGVDRFYQSLPTYPKLGSKSHVHVTSSHPVQSVSNYGEVWMDGGYPHVPFPVSGISHLDRERKLMPPPHLPSPPYSQKHQTASELWGCNLPTLVHGESAKWSSARLIATSRWHITHSAVDGGSASTKPSRITSSSICLPESMLVAFFGVAKPAAQGSAQLQVG